MVTVGDIFSSPPFCLSEPTAALAMESKSFTLDVHPHSPVASGVQQLHGGPTPMECTPVQTTPQPGIKVRHPGTSPLE